MSRKRLEAIQRATSAADAALSTLRQRIAATRLAQLIDRCSGSDKPTQAADEIDAILATPFIVGSERARLWAAHAQLTQRLNMQTLRLDHHERLAGHCTAALSADDQDAALAEATQYATQQYRISFELLRLGGLTTDPQLSAALLDKQGRVQPAEIARMAHAWHVTLRDATGDQHDLARQAAISRIFPPLTPMPLLDQPETNPVIQWERTRQRELWAWLSDRYHYRTEDGPDAEFFARLAVEYAPYAPLTTQLSLQTQGPTSLDDLGSRAPQTSCVIDWTTNVAAGPGSPLSIHIVNPAQPWLVIEPQQNSIGKHPSSPLELAVSLLPGASFEQAAPRGFMICWNLAGRTYHRLIDIPALGKKCDLDVLLSTNAKSPEPTVQQIQIRPGAKSQAFYLYVQNRGLLSRKVNVLVNSDPAARCTVEIAGGQIAAARFPPPPPAPTGAAAGAAPPSPSMTGPLIVTLQDAETHQQLCSRTIPVLLLDPRQYVSVEHVQFTPVTNTHNRLEIDLRQQEAISGPPCPVTLDLSPAQVPGLLGIGDGVLQGSLSPGGQSLVLSARNLRLAEGTSQQGSFSLTVDGVPRTFVFDATFARGGDPTTPTEALRPALRISVPPTGRSGAPLEVHTQTDYAPANATLDILLGRQLATGEFICERSNSLPGPRERRIHFSPSGKNGALEFQGSISDWQFSLDTAGIVGHRVVKARLLASDLREIAVAQQELVLGNQPPLGVQFVEIPSTAWNGKPLGLTVYIGQSVPEVSKVTFFLGKPADNNIPKGAVTAAGAAIDTAKTTWSCQLPLKTTDEGVTPVSALCTNAAGLSTIVTTSVTLTADDIHAAAIHGHVVEGTIPQSGIEVVLTDEKGSEKGKVTTAADGSFTFHQLKPGSYRMSASKATSGRRGTASAQSRKQRRRK